MNERRIPARNSALRSFPWAVAARGCIAGFFVFTARSSPAQGLIFSTDFSSDPASNFVSYNSATVFDWDAGNQRLHADRASSTPYAGFYQLTNSAATALADAVLQTTVSVTTGTPNNLYAVIGGVQARIASGAGSYTSGYYAVLGRPSWDRDDPALHIYLGRDMVKSPFSCKSSWGVRPPVGV